MGRKTLAKKVAPKVKVTEAAKKEVKEFTWPVFEPLDNLPKVDPNQLRLF